MDIATESRLIEEEKKMWMPISAIFGTVCKDATTTYELNKENPLFKM